MQPITTARLRYRHELRHFETNRVAFPPHCLQNKMVFGTSARMAIRQYGRLIRPVGVVVTRLPPGMLILLYLLAFIVILPNVGGTASPAGLTEVSGQDVVIEARDGLITATFNDRTDDSVLRPRCLSWLRRVSSRLICTAALSATACCSLAFRV